MHKNRYDENLIVGLETSDDAAVYKINEQTAIIETLDFFTPIVDDPYTFGQIAATNALSDVYAMGGDPIMAMNIVGFPSCFDPQILSDILNGGFDKVSEAGALLIGGHTVQDDEPKYGLSVTGFVRPDKVIKNSNLKAGDILILTKPIGSGIINTAIKGGLCRKIHEEAAIEVMRTLNKFGKEAMDKVDNVHACTDITGFGFLGHLYEMARGSEKTILINSKGPDFIDGAYEYACMGLVPKGSYDNRKFVGDNIDILSDVDRAAVDIMYDPQTSGGLLISISKANAGDLMDALKDAPFEAKIVGEVLDKKKKYIYVE